MFKFLKEKFSGWLSKKEPNIDKPKVEEAKVKKETPKKQTKPKKQEKSKSEIKVQKKPDKKEKLSKTKKQTKETPKKQPRELIEESPQDIEETVTPEKKKIIEEPEVESAKETPEVKQEQPIEKPQEKPLEKKSFFAKLKDKFISEEISPQVEVKETAQQLIEQTPVQEEQGFFSKLKQKLTTSILKQEEFDEIFSEFEITLLENNVALQVVDKIHESLAKDLVGVSVKSSDVETRILNALKNSILQVLIDGQDLVEKIKANDKHYVILFFGINGTGKTTSIAKLAWLLKSQGISVVLGAADTFRAASIEQLEKHAIKVGVPIVKSHYNADPASVAFDTVQYARKNNIKVALIDTAGRMYTQGNLMREMEKIVKVSQPDLKIFVGESITGNDATEQAKSFNDSVGIDGIILSKADVDDKSGTILSVSYITGKPIFYLGVGQEYKDLQLFKKFDVLKGLGLE